MPSPVPQLLAWYRKYKRDLPWRTTANPYRIFVSEMMLQQTQVDRVIPKYTQFLKHFPTWTSLARARTNDLIHAWAGLGYNRRALYAREAAKTVLAAKKSPHTEEEWRRLKGVGPYMAAALAEFVNGKRAIVMDTNVRRVVGRIWLGLPYPRTSHDPQIIRVLQKITPHTSGHADLPQAFMDFANAVCLPRTPACASCPLRTSCKASKRFLSGRPILRTTHYARRTERIHRDKKHPDRIYRGRILSWIRKHGTWNVQRLGPHIDEAFDHIADQDWIRAMADRLVKDGLLAWKIKNILSLPQ